MKRQTQLGPDNYKKKSVNSLEVNKMEIPEGALKFSESVSVSGGVKQATKTPATDRTAVETRFRLLTMEAPE